MKASVKFTATDNAGNSVPMLKNGITYQKNKK